MSEPFIAEVRIFAGNFAPRGWAFCLGQELPISQYTELFSVIGTTYGGDGRSTLGLPNLQARTPVHPGAGPGLTPRRLGESSGSPTVTLTEAEMPPHTHALQTATANASTDTPANDVLLAQGAGVGGRGGASFKAYGAAQNLVAMAPASISGAGGGQAHDNMQPYLAMNYIIALQGLFPSRS